jgi:hypothetical protein
MPNLSNTTRDHDEIRRWAEERGGKPAHVKKTGSADDIGILRIDFPGYSGEGSLEPISWEDFFRKFDERGLALVYQEETAGGQKSNFNKLVSAESVEEGAGGRQRRSGAARGRSGGSRRSRSGTSTTARKGAAPKKAAASTSTRSGARPKKASAKKASSKNASTRKSGAKKASSRAAAGKKSSAKKSPSRKQPPSRRAAKKGATRRGR